MHIYYVHIILHVERFKALLVGYLTPYSGVNSSSETQRKCVQGNLLLSDVFLRIMMLMLRIMATIPVDRSAMTAPYLRVILVSLV